MASSVSCGKGCVDSMPHAFRRNTMVTDKISSAGGTCTAKYLLTAPSQMKKEKDILHCGHVAIGTKTIVVPNCDFTSQGGNRRRQSYTNCDKIIPLRGRGQTSPSRSSADSNNDVFSEARTTVTGMASFNSSRRLVVDCGT